MIWWQCKQNWQWLCYNRYGSSKKGRRWGGAGRVWRNCSFTSSSVLFDLSTIRGPCSIFYYSLKLYGTLKATEIYQHTFARLKVHWENTKYTFNYEINRFKNFMRFDRLLISFWYLLRFDFKSIKPF